MFPLLYTKTRLLVLRRCSNCRRRLSELTFNWTHLSERSLIKVEGSDSSSFLQGLITNDIRHLHPNEGTSVHLRCLYSFLLQPNGRVLSDLLIYKLNAGPAGGSKEDAMLLECDASSLDIVLKTLKSHKLRRKVNISLDDNRKVFVVFPQLENPLESNRLPSLEIVDREDVLFTHDPRLSLLGYRLLAPSFVDLMGKSAVQVPATQYTQYRYKLGVGEGSTDHPSGNCFPLECNADYLHGVSFHKGCYVGQELTARTYHTGVIRKRLMPIVLPESDIGKQLEANATIISPDGGKRIGKFRSSVGNRGLALLNVEEVCKSNNKATIKDRGIEIRSITPFWWPKTATKDNIPSGRPDYITSVNA